MRGKENKQANIRSPIRTRSYTQKHGEVIGTQTKRSVKVPKKEAKMAVKKISKPKSAISIDSLGSDSLELIFQFVGVDDTIRNLRGVCRKWKSIAERETLSQHFINANNWKEDRPRGKASFEYCVQRATVRSFYQKAGSLFINLFGGKKVPPSAADVKATLKSIASDITVFEDDDDDEEKSIKLTLPWQYKEFLQFSNGLKIGSNFEFLKLEKINALYGEDRELEELLDEIHTNQDCPGSQAWVVIATIGEYDELMLCCDKDHPDFGRVSGWSCNCNDALPFAVSFLELFKGLYTRVQIYMEQYKVDEGQLKKLIKEDSNLEHNFFFFKDWVDSKGRANTKKTFDNSYYKTENSVDNEDDE